MVNNMKKNTHIYVFTVHQKLKQCCNHLYLNKKKLVRRSNTILVVIQRVPCEEYEAYNLSSQFSSKAVINLHQTPTFPVPPIKVVEISVLFFKK